MRSAVWNSTLSLEEITSIYNLGNMISASSNSGEYMDFKFEGLLEF